MKTTNYEINTLHGKNFQRCGKIFTPKRQVFSVSTDASDQTHLPLHKRLPSDEKADLSESQFAWVQRAEQTDENPGGLLEIAGGDSRATTVSSAEPPAKAKKESK